MSEHAPDCACCVGASSKFLPRQRATKRPLLDEEVVEWECEEENQEEGDEEGEEEGEEEDEGERTLINSSLFKSFDAHVANLDAARLKRIEALSFKSALEEDGEGEINEDATQDDIDCLGVWMPGDEFQGDVNYRTLQKLLTRVDQRGFERSSQQLEFHVAFLKAAARVIYRGSWETERPAIMRKHGWEKSNSEVLISTPRRFGKTFRCT